MRDSAAEAAGRATGAAALVCAAGALSRGLALGGVRGAAGSDTFAVGIGNSVVGAMRAVTTGAGSATGAGAGADSGTGAAVEASDRVAGGTLLRFRSCHSYQPSSTIAAAATPHIHGLIAGPGASSDALTGTGCAWMPGTEPRSR